MPSNITETLILRGLMVEATPTVLTATLPVDSLAGPQVFQGPYTPDRLIPIFDLVTKAPTGESRTMHQIYNDLYSFCRVIQDEGNPA